MRKNTSHTSVRRNNPHLYEEEHNPHLYEEEHNPHLCEEEQPTHNSQQKVILISVKAHINVFTPHGGVFYCGLLPRIDNIQGGSPGDFFFSPPPPPPPPPSENNLVSQNQSNYSKTTRLHEYHTAASSFVTNGPSHAGTHFYFLLAYGP